MRKEDLVKAIMMLNQSSNVDYETLMACDIYALGVHFCHLMKL